MITGLLAMFGLLPMELSHSLGALTQRPLAVIVKGGLISTTFIILVVLPSVYLWVIRKNGVIICAEKEDEMELRF